ncbi:MAG: hypothetical protein OHK0011_11780 [Turneriella sp.]
MTLLKNHEIIERLLSTAQRHFVLVYCLALVLPSSVSGLGKASYTEKGTAELAVFASASYASAGSAALYYGFAPTFNYFFAEDWYVGGDLGLYYYLLDSGNYQNIDANFASLNYSPSATLGHANTLSYRLYWFSEFGYGYAVCASCLNKVLGNSLVTSFGLKYEFPLLLTFVGVSLIYNEQWQGIVRFFAGFSAFF